MTNLEIFKYSLMKAFNNGWKISNVHLLSEDSWNILYNKYEMFIFNPEFAKYFFGNKEELFELYNGFMFHYPAWKYHLQQLVILDEDERFKYLEKFLYENN